MGPSSTQLPKSMALQVRCGLRLQSRNFRSTTLAVEVTVSSPELVLS